MDIYIKFSSIKILSFICFCTLGVNTLFLSKLDKFQLMTDRLNEMLEDCAGNSINVGMILSDSDKTIHLTGGLLKKVSFYHLRYTDFNTSNFSINMREKLLPRKQMDIYIIISSIKNLKFILNSIKQFLQNYHLGLYVIIDSYTNEHGCINVKNLLWISWKFDLLSLITICIDPTDGLLIYSFNPYNDFAPNSWQKVATYYDTDKDHDWILFKQKYLRGRTTCKDLSFHKTSTLNGYKVTAFVIPIKPDMILNLNDTSCTTYSGIDGNIIRLLCMTLNMSISSQILTDTTDSYGFIDSTGVAHGIFLNVTNNDVEILLNSQYNFNKPGLTMTYPHADTGLSVLSRFVGFETEGMKILKFMNPIFIIGVFLIFFTTVFIFIKAYHIESIEAFLEVLRIVVGHSLLNRVISNALRIYFMTVVLLFFITSSIFASNTAAILTSPVPKINIDGISTLKKTDRITYIFKGYKNLLDDILQDRVIVINNWNCSKYVIENPNALCIADRADLMEIAYRHNLYLSLHRIHILLGGFIIRPNWPLKKRVEQILRRTNDAGLLRYLSEEAIIFYKRKWHIMRMEMKMKKFKNMTLYHLSFNFILLLFGLTTSTIVFLFEIYQLKNKIHYSHKNNMKLRKKHSVPILPFVN